MFNIHDRGVHVEKKIPVDTNGEMRSAKTAKASEDSEIPEVSLPNPKISPIVKNNTLMSSGQLRVQSAINIQKPSIVQEENPSQIPSINALSPPIANSFTSISSKVLGGTSEDKPSVKVKYRGRNNVSIDEFKGEKNEVHRLQSEPAPILEMRAQQQASMDARIQCDYSAWKKGARLTVSGLKAAYSGLHNIVLEHSLVAWKSILVIECVVRPDVPAASLLDVMTRVAKTSRMEGGGGVMRIQARNNSHIVIEAALTDNSEEINREREWDMVDVQLCVSRELRQRVLLCQFLKQQCRKSNSKEDASDSTHSSSSSSASALLSETGALLAPGTKRFARVMQRMLTQQHLSLSSLYQVSFDQVAKAKGPEGLDIQFCGQLEDMSKESMSGNLRHFYDDVEERTEQFIRDTEGLIALVTPVYRQHGALGDLSRFDNDTLSDQVSTGNKMKKAVQLHVNSSQSFDSGSDDHGQVVNKSWCEEYIDIYGNECTTSVYSPQKRSDSTPPVNVDSDQSQNSQALKIKDGLTICVEALDALWIFFSVRAERKSKELRSRKSEDALSTMNAMLDHRKRFLRTLTHSTIPQTSSLTKVFIEQFKGTSVTENSIENFDEVNSQDSQSAETSNTVEASNIVEASGTGKLSGTVSAERAAEKISAAGGGIFGWLISSALTPSKPVTAPSRSGQITRPKRKTLSMFPPEQLVVLCYCTCWVAGTPATMYITPRFICFSCGFPGFTFITRDIFPVEKLDSVHIDAPKNESKSGFSLQSALQPTVLSLVFFAGGPKMREMRVSPAVLECDKLRILLLQIRNMSISDWADDSK